MHLGHGCVFWGTFFEKIAFCLLSPPKQLTFLTASNEIICLKVQGTRLGVIVTPNKGLE